MDLPLPGTRVAGGRARGDGARAADDAYYRPHARFSGTLGAGIVRSEATDAETEATIHARTRGPFRAPRAPPRPARALIHLPVAGTKPTFT